jgi:hypothetical protein
VLDQEQKTPKKEAPKEISNYFFLSELLEPRRLLEPPVAGRYGWS